MASKPVEVGKPHQYGFFGWCMIFVSYFSFVAFLPFSLFFTFKIVRDYERAVIFRLGRIMGKKDRQPGLMFLLPCIDTYHNIDMRTISFSVTPQEILTKDSVMITLEIVVFYRVENAMISVMEAGNPYTSTAHLSRSIARNIVASKFLQEIICDRVGMCDDMKKALIEVTKRLGIAIERVDLKDLRLPDLLQKAMNALVEAETEAKSKLKAAEGEKNASYALLKASELIQQSPTALQLRYLQTLTKIAAKNNSTIVFPVPVELLPTMSNFYK